jgi:hypothetical protein
MNTPHKNRRERQKPHGKCGWCIGCDAYYANGEEKCPVCGVRNVAKGKRLKKPAPTIEEFD